MPPTANGVLRFGVFSSSRTARLSTGIHGGQTHLKSRPTMKPPPKSASEAAQSAVILALLAAALVAAWPPVAARLLVAARPDPKTHR